MGELQEINCKRKQRKKGPSARHRQKNTQKEENLRSPRK